MSRNNCKISPWGRIFSKVRNPISILLLVLFPASFLYAQDAGIQGNITSENGEPMIGVTVLLKGTTIGATTDINGHFKLTALNAGKYTVVISYLGYTTKEETVSLSSGEKKTLSVRLAEDELQLQTTTITAKSHEQKIREQAFNVVAIDAKKLYNTSSDINQILNRTAGVKIRESGGLGSKFNFSLNGFSGNQVKFFIDGVPITNYGESMTLNNIPVNMAERIEVYKGVVPVSLGVDALGGAVNVVTNQNVRNYLDVSYNIASFHTHRASVNARYTHEKTGFTIGLNAFGNYAENDYKVDVSIVDAATGKFGPLQKLKHFHDGYKSGTVILETGVVGKKFADRLLFGIIVSGNENEVQQGTNMLKVVGEAKTYSSSVIPTFKYKKENLFTDGLNLNISGSVSLTEGQSIDTSSKVYDWTGQYKYRSYGNVWAQGELGEKTHYIYTERDALTAANLSYSINPNHIFTFNNTFSHYLRTERDEVRVNRLGLVDPTIIKNITGLGYNNRLLGDRLTLTAFGKLFYMNSKMALNDSTAIQNKHLSVGYGTGVTYFINSDFQYKASFEKTYRLPEPDELLGDGLNVLFNPLLKPENSFNVNSSFIYDKYIKDKHHIGFEAGFIFRRALNFIRSTATGPLSVHENIGSVRALGGEFQAKYSFKEMIFFEVNTTYQHLINTVKYAPPGTQIPNYVYKYQLPNLPFLYGNADLDFRFKNVITKNDALTANLGMNYMEAFYLFWPSLGSNEYKREIPRQITGNAGVTYSLKNGRYNISAECRNFTNTKVYDYFNVQKPGRSFSLKVRYFLTKTK